MWRHLYLICLLAYCLEIGIAEDLSVAHLVLRYGYPFEEHEVVTEDGYILALHRIPYGNKNPYSIRRPMILQHGLMASSACYVLANPNNSLGFIMADEGYDVWMPNNRGNTYSMKHVTLDPNKKSDKKKFWDFSFHEMGYYDLAAIIDYVLNKTKEQNLYYIGHSQGTTQFFALMSMRPEYNEKVVHMSALAPIAFMDNTRGTVKFLIYIGSILEKIAKLFNIYDVLSSSPFLRGIEKFVCKSMKVTEFICQNLLFLITGYDSQEINLAFIPVITTYFPTGTSIKQLVHYGQLGANGERFRLFDYGKEENLKRYNQSAPPDYDLSKITTPVMLHYSQNDWISGIPDVLKLNASLPNSSSLLVPFYYFNHLDFMWAKDVRLLLYDPMLDIIKQY